MFLLLAIFSHGISMGSTDVGDYISMDDILRPNLMPTFFMFDGSTKNNLRNVTANTLSNLTYDGTWKEAFDTMKFHRQMLNEYLCRKFIASNIITHFHPPLISKRMGTSFSINKDDYPSPTKRKSRADLADVKENLLSDPGSSNYRDWLTKTTTLDDVYRHYGKSEPVSRIMDDTDVEYEGGEVTGYAVPHPNEFQNSNNMNQYLPPDETIIQDPEKHGGGYDYTPHHIHFHGGEEKDSHSISLPDVFEVALTALAFLSFGIFILQVIMCISANKAAPMMQMVDPPPDTTGAEGIRFRRETTNHFTINELAKKVLQSIDAGLAAEKDNGSCLRKTLCENNKYSKSLDFKKRILIPIWGLAMSWLSSRIIKDSPPTTTILESLKACALGLSGADCTSFYSCQPA